MKTVIFSLLFFSFAVLAQAQTASITSKENKFYAGIGLTNISYHIYYKEPKSSGHINTGYFAPIALNLGYKLSDRARLQVGLAYGGSKSRNDRLGGPLDSVEYDYYSHTRVIALPVTMQYILFRAFKRFPIYVTGTVMPAYGMSKSKTIETRNSGTTAYQVTDVAMNVFATAGFGFNYRISNRFQGYVEILPFKYNMNGRNSIDRDWEQYASKSRQLYRSLSFGINYSL